MPPIGERVTAVEVSLDNLTESHKELRLSVENGFREVKQLIREVSPNGQTPVLIAMAKDFGDEESRVAIRRLIRSQRTRLALNRPAWRIVEIAGYGFAGAGSLALLHRLLAGTWY